MYWVLASTFKIFRLALIGCSLLTVIVCNGGCKKYLSALPDTALAIPHSLSDLQQLMDQYSLMNETSYPVASEIVADDYYLTMETWNAMADQTTKMLYLWQPVEAPASQWTLPYAAIANANVVMDELAHFEKNVTNTAEWNNVMGSALFFRAYYFWGLAQLFCKPFDSNSSIADLGICLRINSDVSLPSYRATVRESYDQIIQDFKNAAALLPDKPLVKSRPGVPAVYGALARVYLSMRMYDSAGLYASKCIDKYGKDSLLDFNNPLDVDLAANASFKRFNREVVFQIRSSVLSALAGANSRIDSMLYRSYREGDLRSKAYFSINADNTYRFKGDYDGRGSSVGYVFAGITLDEMYLIEAECRARNNLNSAARMALNTLLESRWKEGSYIPITENDSQLLLKLILLERRKELIRRGTRWTDIRRLSFETENSIVPIRNMTGTYYYLPLHSNRYVLKIPAIVIATAGIPQNE